MRYRRLADDGYERLCTGPCHEWPTWLPETEEFFGLHSRERHEFNPRCKRCTRAESRRRSSGRGSRLGEAEVVEGAQLSAVLRRWIVVWLSERPLSESSLFAPRAREADGEPSTVMGPIQYLAEHSGVHTRRVSGLCNGEYPFVSLTQAELLLTAANLEHMLSTGEVEVIPNPTWSLRAWVDYMQARGCY